MRRFFQGFTELVGTGALIMLLAPTAIGNDQFDETTIRPVPASHSMDEPPTLPDDEQPQALPAEPASTAAPAASAAAEQVKMPVARLPFRRSSSPAMATRAMPEPQVTNQTRQALGFYGGNPARQTLSQFPRRTPIQAGPPMSMRQQIKPFHTVYRDPTVSPYLNLYREEDDTQSAPNYFALVRPQMDQIEASRMQQGEIQQVMRQMQGRSRTVAGPQYRSAGYQAGYPAAGASGGSTPARYMDTAQFYGGWAK